MSENQKTLIFVVVAVAVGAMAAVFRPGTGGVDLDEQVGQPLFEKFEDPLAANHLEIVRYDAAAEQIRRFEVGQVDGIWSIKSRQDYPADAEDQMKDAATSLFDLKILRVASQRREDQKLFGVVEPTSEQLAEDNEGMGLLVRLRNAKGDTLAELVIGKPVRDAEDQRFVRVPGKDPIYTIKVSADKLTTQFEDWIEKDLLQLSPFDIEQVTLKDYSVQAMATITGQTSVDYDQRLVMTVSPTDDGKWKLDELLEWRNDVLAPAQLLEHEELNTERLGDLKTALDDLRIVDVQRKPQGLGVNLKADKGLLEDSEGIGSLISRGFYPVGVSGSDQIELLSTDGEVQVRMKDGVDYMLRFGGIVGLEEGDSEKSNRFILVTARLNEAKFPRPELEPLPTKPNTQPEEKTSEDQQDADSEQADAKPDEAQAAAALADDGDNSGNDESDSEEQASDSDEDEASAEQDEQPDLAAEIDRVQKENQRKLDEHKEKLDAAKKRVDELSYRFADWYYVISEDVYKKIHLGRADIIKESESAKEEGIGVDAFRKLEEDGLKKEVSPAPSGPDA